MFKNNVLYQDYLFIHVSNSEEGVEGQIITCHTHEHKIIWYFCKNNQILFIANSILRHTDLTEPRPKIVLSSIQAYKNMAH